jgi:HNH endonuclease
VPPVPRALRQALRAEVHAPRCAYCQSPEQLLGMPLEVDHIIPEAAGGKTDLTNLCLCCRPCNSYKWQHTHARDSQTGQRVRLFHPRQQRWAIHFVWSADGASLLGRTVTGRATIDLLRMNNDLIRDLRRLWVALGLHPRDTEL